MVVENLIWKNFKWNENEEFGKLNLAEESLAKNLLSQQVSGQQLLTGSLFILACKWQDKLLMRL